MKQTQKLEHMFMPRSIAVIGASDVEGKVGNAIARNLVSHAYDGDVFFVNPFREKILDRRCFASVMAIGQDVDCAIVVVPAERVIEVVREASAFCHHFVVISAGFGESGVVGHNREMQLMALAHEKGLTILGPNCLGFIMPSLGLNASFAAGLPQKGRVALISQSGALAVAAMDRAASENFGFSAVVSIGNKMQIGAHTLIDYFSRDHGTDVIALYIEGVDHGSEFIHALAAAGERGKRVIVLKSGNTQEAQKAIALHTGSLAGDSEIFRAALRKSGAIHLSSLEEFLACMHLTTIHQGVFSLTHNVRIGVVTNAGGIGVLVTDAIASTEGMQLSRLSQDTIIFLTEKLPSAASVHNPIDLLGDALTDRYHDAITQLIADIQVDVIYVIVTPQMQTPVEEIARAIVTLQQKTKKPIIASFVGGDRVAEAISFIKKNGIVHFVAIDHAVQTMSSMRRRAHGSIAPQKKIDRARIKKAQRVFGRIANRQMLYFDEVATIARAYDMPICAHWEITSGLSAQQRITYPCVAKVDDPSLAHKTEQHGVIMPITNLRDLDRAQKHLRKSFPEKTTRIIAQPLLSNHIEIFIGMLRDPVFGVVIVVGMGGIYAEALHRVDHMIAPLSVGEIMSLLKRGTLSFLFHETRGQQSFDCEGVAHSILAVTQLAIECPEIAAIDINPLLLYNDDRRDTIVDMKIVLS